MEPHEELLSSPPIPPRKPDTDKTSVFGEWKITLTAKGHKYTVVSLINGTPVVGQIDSVTQFSSGLFPKFDADKILKRYKEKGMLKFGGPVTKKQVVKEYWEENANHAALLGTEMHSVIESIFRKYMVTPPPRDYVLPTTLPPPIEGKPFPTIPIVPLYKTGSTIVEMRHLEQLISYFKANHFEPIAIEKCLFSLQLLLCGTLDILVRDTITGDLYILDWKRREEFTTTSDYDTGIPKTPMEGRQHSHLESAIVQLNMYRYMLQEGEHRVIKGLRIISIHPHLPAILVNEIPIDEPLTRALVEYRLKTMTPK